MSKSIFVTALCALPFFTVAQPTAANASLNATVQAMQQQIQQLQQQLQRVQRPRISDTLIINVPSAVPDDPEDLLHHECQAHNINYIHTLQDALSCVDSILIPQSGEVIIKLNESPSTPYDTIEVAHADGDRIQLIGNCQGPCTINFKPSQDGLLVQNGHQLGKVENFKFNGSGRIKQLAGARGIRVNNHAAIIEAKNIEVTRFSMGLEASANSLIAGENINATDNYYFGIYSYINGTIMLTGINQMYKNEIDLLADGGQIHCIGCNYEARRANNYGFIWDESHTRRD